MTKYQCDPDQIEYHGCSQVPFDFMGGMVGHFGYELKMECYPDVSFKTQSEDSVPDAAFLFCDQVVVFDHIEKEMYLVKIQSSKVIERYTWFEEMESRLSRIIPNAATPCAKQQQSDFSITLLHDQKSYIDNIYSSLESIKDGESYEVCLTTQLSSSVALDHASPSTFYKTLRKNNPAPYGAFLTMPSHSLACSSPELFIKVDLERKVSMKPIKGTMARAPFSEGLDYTAWLKHDQETAKKLERSEKDRAENLMVRLYKKIHKSRL